VSDLHPETEREAFQVYEAVLAYRAAVRRARERWPEDNPERFPDRFERLEWARGRRGRHIARASAVGKAKAALWRELGRIFQEEL
jgi:hypothetical protein